MTTEHNQIRIPLRRIIENRLPGVTFHHNTGGMESRLAQSFCGAFHQFMGPTALTVKKIFHFRGKFRTGAKAEIFREEAWPFNGMQHVHLGVIWAELPDESLHCRM